jgi:hypothetical protein
MAPLAILLISVMQAQVVVPNVTETRTGGQLLLYYDAVKYDVVYLTLTNTGPSNIVLHMVLYGADCVEQFDYVLIICPYGHKIYDMARFDLGNARSVDLRGNKGFLLATPTDSSGNAPAVPYNHLAGNTVHANIATANSFGLNAVARLAVDATGAPLADYSGTLDGVTMMFQRIQPAKLWHDGFFALSTITDSRILLFSFVDVYSPTNYTIAEASVTLSNFAWRVDCAGVSLAPKIFKCFLDATIQSFIGGGYGSFIVNSGTLQMIPLGYVTNQNFFGIASQTLSTYTVNRYLWGK